MAKPLREIVPLDEQGTLAGGGRDRTEVATRPNKLGTIARAGRPAGVADPIQKTTEYPTASSNLKGRNLIVEPPGNQLGGDRSTVGGSGTDTGGPGQTVAKSTIKKQPEIALK